MRKLKILLVNEASFLNTGYSLMGLELLTRLHNSGLYEVAELAAYGHPLDHRRFSLGWTYYGNSPFLQGLEPNQDEVNKYNQNWTNQFGAFRFEETVLHFKPDIVLDFRDEWMMAYEGKSPLRQYYNWTIMPTVDGSPQDSEWINTFSLADNVFTYTDWGQSVLRQQGNGILNLRGSLSPGVNLGIFRKLPKNEVRKQFGLSNDVFIIGTVMRNQRRKLYPNLLGAFRKYLDYCKENNRDLYNKSYLYLHTTYPDIGWSIPDFIKDNELSSKVLTTYICSECHFSFASFFQDSITTCINCGKNTAKFPTTQHGVDANRLSEIYNLFDAYVQYANSEGFGIPMIEAAACEVPVFATDYSAMSDVVRKIDGYPIDVLTKYYESETHCQRAIPNDDNFIEQLYKFATLPRVVREARGFKSSKGVEKYFTWSKMADTLHSRLQSQEYYDRWNQPPRIIRYNNQLPNNLSNEDFVRYCYMNILHRPDLIDTYRFMKDVKDLNYGFRVNKGMSQAPVTQEILANQLADEVDNNNYWEERRCGLRKEPMPVFIQQRKEGNQ